MIWYLGISVFHKQIQKFICKLERPAQTCKNVADKLKSLEELLLEPDINPCFTNKDDVED